MAKWTNSDGLVVKFGTDRGDPLKGGQLTGNTGVYISEFTVDYTDALSATSAVLGSASGTYDGALGVQVPEGARIKAIETIVQTAFTSSGTIGSATLELGLKKWSDLSTQLDDDGFFTTSVTGTVLGLATVGSRVYTTVGSTGAGALIGTTLSEDGVITLRNSAHATHPFTAGKLLVRLEYFYP